MNKCVSSTIIKNPRTKRRKNFIKCVLSCWME